MSAEHEREGEMVPSKEATKARHVVKILASEYGSLLEIKEAAAAHQQTMQQLQARLDDVNVKDSVKTREINLLVDENKRLHARVKELEDREWVAALFMDDVDNTAQVQAIQGLQVRVKELEAVKELSDWVDKQMQAGLVVAHEFVHGCGLFDGIDAGKCVIETAARYGWQFKQRADRLQADLDSWQKQAEIQADSLRTAQAEVERLQRLAVHCPDCGGDYAATGLEVGCQCKLLAEVERLKAISVCQCGDHFTLEDPGTCGNCLATYYQDRVKTGTVMAKVDR